jgi:sugar lactone lactonase YvrE
LFAIICPQGNSQTSPLLTYASALTPVAKSSGGYTVDPSGNIYVISSDGLSVQKETSFLGTYPQSTVSPGSASDLLAVDGSGDVFRLSGGTLYEEVNQITGPTYQVTPYAERVAYNFTDAISLMVVDNTGHVYVFDATQNQLLKLTLTPSGWVQSYVATGLSGVVSIGVDINQNVYALELNGTSGTVEKFTSSGSGYVGGEFTSGLKILAPQIAVDASGDVYVEQGSGLAITEFVTGTAKQITIPCPPSGCPYYGGSNYSSDAFFAGPDGNFYFDASGTIYKEVAGSPNFGTVDVGNASTTYLAFAQLGEVAFSATVDGPFGYYGIQDSCTVVDLPPALEPFCYVPVTFTPPGLGLYQDQLKLTNSNSSPITVMLQGTGAAPQIGFSPAPRSIILSSAAPYNLQGPEGIAADGKGNLYIADTGGRQVLKETLSNGQYTQTVIANAQNGLRDPIGVAVDANGNVYIADPMVGILKETLASSVYTQSTAITAGGPEGVAVDANGALYFTNLTSVIKAVPNGGQYTQTTLLSSLTPGNSTISTQGVAIDASGNVYVTDTGNQRVLKLSPANGSYTQSTVASGFGFPWGVAVDFAGNVYVGDEGGGIYKESLSNGVYSQTLMNGSIGVAYGVAVDGSENVYAATSQPAYIYEIPAVQTTTLSFASTPVGTTSPDSPQTLTVQNVGTYPLTFTLPGTGTNPSISAGFTIGTANTCLDLFTSSTGAELMPGGSCTYQISFAPTTAGAISGSLTFTDNSDNVAGASQTITLMGTATAAGNKSTPTVAVTPSSSSITTAQAVTVTVSVSGLSGSSTPTGSVRLTSGSYTSAATTLSSGTATISVPAGSLATGMDTLTVTYTPDSSSAPTYNSASNMASVTVTAPGTTTPVVTVSPSSSSITTAQALTVTVAVSGGNGDPTPTGSVILASGSYTSAATTLSSGSATIDVPSGSLTAGSDTLTATYTPDSSSSSIYDSSTGTNSVTVIASIATTSAVTLSPTSLTFASQVDGITSKTQTVTLTNSGTAALTIVAIMASGDFAQTNTCGASVAAGANCAISVTFTPTAAGNRTGTLTITDNASGSPQTVALSGGGEAVSVSTSSTGLTIASPGGSATATIQLSPQDGFTGTVNLTCAVSYLGQGTPNSPPTCALSPSQAQITGTSSGSSTLTVSTTAASAMAELDRKLSNTGFALAALIFLGALPRRRWRGGLLAAALCLLVIGGVIGCSGSNGGGTNSTPPSPSGTTTGSYQVMVTATSGTATASTTIPLSVQ